MKHFLIEFFVVLAGGGLESDLFVGEEGEVVDEDTGGFLEGVLGEDCAVGGYFESKFVVVCLLVYAEVLDGNLYVLDGSVD